MCAGGEGKDVCQGFGGAPLFIMQDGMYSQVSILSCAWYVEDMRLEAIEIISVSCRLE